MVNASKEIREMLQSIVNTEEHEAFREGIGEYIVKIEQGGNSG